MDKEDSPYSFKEPAQPSNGFKEVFASLRTIFVAAIALVISIADWLLSKFSNWQAKAEEQAKLINDQKAAEQEKLLQQKLEKEKAIREENRKADEQAKISQEQRDEERARREAEREAKDNELKIRKFIYPVLSSISTITLIVGVARLSPIAKWTKSQNECIQKTSIGNPSNQISLANKVMRCNGGHE